MARQRWLRGNTHTHTLYSDGDSSPEVVVDWYAGQGYDFLFLTDHNVLIPDAHMAELGRRGLAVWQGEEITMSAVHVNGLGLTRPIFPPEPARLFAEPYVARGRTERVAWAIAEVAAQDGVASVNHPLLWDTLDVDQLREIDDGYLIEVANMHHEMELVGGDVAAERLWDGLLARNRRVWAVAADDAHHFAQWGPTWANPGRGWVMVEAEAPDAVVPEMGRCLAALDEGRFYASTGLELAEYRASSDEIALDLASGPATVELIGPEGRVLEVIEGEAARFSLARSSAAYARVRASDGAGRKLWTQPYFR